MSALKNSLPHLDRQQAALALFLAHMYIEYDLPARANALLHALQVGGAVSSQVYVLRAMALIRLDTPEQALTLLDEAALNGELGLGYHLVRAQALVLTGRRHEAEDAFHSFLDAAEASPAGALGGRRISQD